jgi:spore coat protein U-like protein
MGTTMVLAAAMLASESVYAAPTMAVRIPVHAKMFSRDKQMVNFHLRNDSKEPLTVKAGGQELTLEPGKPVNVSLKIGETVTVAKATPRFAEGTVLATVNSDLKDATIALR